MDKDVIFSWLVAQADWKMITEDKNMDEFSWMPSGTYWIDDRYNFLSTGTVEISKPFAPTLRREENIRVYLCKRCNASLLINIANVSTLNITCPSCGSVDMDRKE